MKILISHSSKNANYGQALVDLLVAVGVNSEQIIFTSNDAFGIPTGQNIFNWLKARISEKPHVVYLLSSAYYASIACLNEMGAAWIVESEHTIIFTSEFNTSSYEFQNGVLDPREMGFKITNHDRVTAFVEMLRESFSISKNAVLVGQKIREFIQKVESFKEPKISTPIENTIVIKTAAIAEDFKTETQYSEEPNVEQQILKKTSNENLPQNDKKQQAKPMGSSPQVTKFFKDLLDGKLKDEEVLLIHYAIDTARNKLGTGWQASNEIQNIETWEDVRELRNELSSKYSEVIRRFELKKLTEVSDTTSYGNPKEASFVSEFRDVLLELPNEIQVKINEVLARNEKVELTCDNQKDDDLPPF